jgi:hypothetical protein
MTIQVGRDACSRRIAAAWRELVCRMPAGALAATPVGLTEAPHDGGIGTAVAIALVHAVGIAAVVAMYLYFRGHDQDDGREGPGGGGPDRRGGGPDRPRPPADRYMPREVSVFVPSGMADASERRVRQPAG